VGDIVSAVDVGQSTVSHHLRILHQGGFVHIRRVGTSSIVEINEDCLARFPATTAAILGQIVDDSPDCSGCEDANPAEVLSELHSS
jgi:DNA-binding transcriptional ArsR family regulator